MKFPIGDFVLEVGIKAEATAMQEKRDNILILNVILEVVAMDCERDIMSTAEFVSRGVMILTPMCLKRVLFS